MIPLDFAPALLTNGYSPVPISNEIGGRCPLEGWDRHRKEPLHVETLRWNGKLHPEYQLAVLGAFNGLVPIDVDTDDAEVIAAFKRVMPRPVVARKGSKGFVAFYRDPTGKVADYYRKNFMKRVADADGVIRPLVEIKVMGHVTIPPSLHRKTGQPYRWMNCQPGRPARSLFDTPVAELGVVTIADLEALSKALEPWCPPVAEYVAPKATRAVADAEAIKRYQAMADKEMERVPQLLIASGAASGDICAKARRLAKWVRAEYLDKADVVKALTDACVSAGWTGKDNMKQVGWSIASGFKRGHADPLPELVDRPYDRSRTQDIQPRA